MSKSMLINLFLLDGTANGRIRCTVNTRSGIIFKIPRKDLPRCKGTNGLEELENDGVYFLLGEENGKQKLYVGQAGSRKNGKGLINRLNEHERSADKNFWTEAIVFTTSNNSFGSTEISWLENKFHEIAFNAARFEVVNGNEPSPGNITTEKKSELEDQVDFAKRILSAIGYKIFEQPQKNSPPPVVKTDEDIFLLPRKIKKLGRALDAKMKITTTGYKILAGSEISPLDDSNLSANMKKLRRSSKILNGKLIEDMEFSSPSSAAQFIIGKNVNGLLAWKTFDGVPLKNFLRDDN